MDFWNASPDYGFLNADFLLIRRSGMKPRSLDIIGTRKRKEDENGLRRPLACALYSNASLCWKASPIGCEDKETDNRC